MSWVAGRGCWSIPVKVAFSLEKKWLRVKMGGKRSPDGCGTPPPCIPSPALGPCVMTRAIDLSC